MAKLIKRYPRTEEKDRIVWEGSISDMIYHLNRQKVQYVKSQEKGSVIDVGEDTETSFSVIIYKDSSKLDEDSISIKYFIVH